MAWTLTSSDSSGSRAQAGSPTIAARWTTRIDAVERARACDAVADVRADYLDTRLLLLGRDVLLAMQQRVEHANLVPGFLQLLYEQRSDVAAAACYQCRIDHLGSSLVVSILDLQRWCP